MNEEINHLKIEKYTNVKITKTKDFDLYGQVIS